MKNTNDIINNTNDEERVGFVAERDGETWATAEAPWVGAEARWRASITPEAPPADHGELSQPELAFRLSVYENLALSEEESRHMQTVISTVAPLPEEKKGSPAKVILSHGALAAAVALVTWTAFNLYSLHRGDEGRRTALVTAVQNTPALPAPAGEQEVLPGNDTAGQPTAPVVEDAPAEVEMTFSEEETFESEKPEKEASIPAEEEKIIADAPADGGEAETPDPAAMATLESIAGPAFRVPDEPVLSPPLPALPQKDEIVRTMDRLASDVVRCRAGEMSGRIVLELVVSGETGKVLSAKTVDDTFKGTSTGRCAAKVVSDAQFSMFERPRLTIRYPYDI